MLHDRLRLIRQARGLSLEELSEATSKLVTKQAISKYETGQDEPSSRVLLALAKALGVPSQTLLAAPCVNIEMLRYRKLAKLGKREQERLESCLAFKLEQAISLRDLVYPDAPFDVPARTLKAESPDEAETQAERLRREWGLGQDPIGNVVDLLEEKGVMVCFVDAEGGFDGLSAIAKSDRKVHGAAVLCRAGLTLQRSRLNVAHELGHVVLRPAEEESEEDLAWRFAGAFLAPKETLLQDVGGFRRTIGIEEMLLLKQRYGMSIQALLMRFKALGVMSQDALKRAFIQLNRMGMRRQEPGDEYDVEEPQWLRRTTLRAVSEGLLSAGQASQILGEPVATPERKQSLVRLLAQMSVEERQTLLGSVENGEDSSEYSEWDSLDEPDGEHN